MPETETRPSLPPIAILQSTRWRLDLAVSGRSMEPLLSEGDAVSIQCLPPGELSVGDVICFRDGSRFVLHRLLEKGPGDGRVLLEKGDAETTARWIDAREVLGRLVAINNQPVNEDQAARLLAFSRSEVAALSWLRARDVLPKKAGWAARCWRWIKTRGPGRGCGGPG